MWQVAWRLLLNVGVHSHTEDFDLNKWMEQPSLLETIRVIMSVVAWIPCLSQCHVLRPSGTPACMHALECETTKSGLFTFVRKKTAQCIHTGLVPMGETGFEQTLLVKHKQRKAHRVAQNAHQLNTQVNSLRSCCMHSKH